MDGILNINKPLGMTSFDVVSIIKRLTREKRVGHAGTLDPMASGVLPVCLGRGTRVVEFLMDAHKVYRAQIELGVATDTYDAAGKVTSRQDPSGIGRARLETALGSFRGRIQQIPPMYSALKHQGQRLYQLARAGVTVSRKSRVAVVYRLELIDFEPPLVTIEVECGKGTYIRSLAHDLGEMLGCGAHLKGLVRLGYGPFAISDAVSLERIEAAASSWQQLAHPMDFVLSHWPAVVVDADRARVIKNGGSLEIEPVPSGDGPEGWCRAYSKDGCFLAVLSLNTESGRWRPEKVFA